MLTKELQEYLLDMSKKILKVIPAAEYEKIAEDDIAVSCYAVTGDTLREEMPMTIKDKRRLNRFRALSFEVGTLICLIQACARSAEDAWRVTQPTMYEVLGRLFSDEDFRTALIMDDRETPPEIKRFFYMDEDEDEDEDDEEIGEEIERGNTGGTGRRGWR